MNDIKGKTVLITGASSGIGEVTAKLLAKAGANIFLTARREDRLLTLKKELEETGVRAGYTVCDLSNIEAPKMIVAKCAETFGGIDVLINNAGIGIHRSVEDSTAEFWDTHMNLNARAPFLMCREALPYLKASGEATVINMSSTLGINSYANQSVYSASKHALRGFTKVFAKEVFPYGIRVHILAPGAVDTDMVSKVRPELDTSTLSRPEELAEVILFLLTHRNNSVIDEIIIRRYSKCPWD